MLEHPWQAVAELYYEMMDGFLRWRAQLAEHDPAAVPSLSEDEPLASEESSLRFASWGLCDVMHFAARIFVPYQQPSPLLFPGRTTNTTIAMIPPLSSFVDFPVLNPLRSLQGLAPWGVPGGSR